MERLALGAAHGLNNAFTAVIGEAGFLREDCKEDARVVEGVEAVLAGMERCVRITRGLMARKDVGPRGDETELIRTVRDLAELLGETLGSRNQLSVEAPDDILPVVGDPAEVELVLLTLVHYAADYPKQGGRRLGVQVVDDGSRGRVVIEVGGVEISDEVILAVGAPEHAPDALTGACLGAVREIAEGLGGSLSAERTAPDGWRATLSLPTADDR